MNIYTNELTNAEILNHKAFRWIRFCLDQDLYTSQTKLFHTISPVWHKVKFKKDQTSKVPRKQGIYMFALDISGGLDLNHTSNYVLYVGQAEDLQSRFNQYFGYELSEEPSDLLKRCMVIIWKERLNFHFFETNGLPGTDLTKMEFDLIDLIVPRINQRFRGRILKKAIKLYSPV